MQRLWNLVPVELAWKIADLVFWYFDGEKAKN
jgi:hypothetical protein